MKKRMQLMKRTLSLFLATAVLSSGIPVYGSESFTDGTSEEAFIQEEILPGEKEDSAQNEIIEFTDAQNQVFTDVQNEDAEETLRQELDYVKGHPLTEEEKAEELAPFAMLEDLQEMPEIGSQLGMGGAMYSMYPEKFDARQFGVITEPKNQHPFGICWAFGMASILETSLLLQNKGEKNLSEEHLAYFFANRENDPLNNTEGDYNHNNQGYHKGGNDTLASIFLTTWSGMTTESSVPYPTDAFHVEDLSVPIPASKAYEVAAYLTDASFSDYSVDRMKQMLYEDKSVAIAIRMENEYYNVDTAAYSHPYIKDESGNDVRPKINHVVTVVGWDDTYKKENFSTISNVQSDGAWIVKNSWGPDWGENGYFYLSYEDRSISGLVSAKATDRVKYKNNYFYDGSSGLKSTHLKPGQSAANVFIAKAKKGYTEVLGEVNTITKSDNAHYAIQVYTDVKNPENPTSGKKAYETPVDVYQAVAGVKTIAVPEVKIPYGTRYSVVVTNTGRETIKYCVEGTLEHKPWFKGTANIKKGQGFFGTTKGEWKDFANYKVTPRIKAHTRTIGEISTPVLSASAKGYDKVILTWGKTEGITGYYLYRSEAGKKKRIATLSAKETSYLDKKLKTGTKYSYTLVPFLKTSGKVIKGTASKMVSATPILEKPVFEAKASSNGYNTITWKKVSGATNYRIYRRVPSGKWKHIGTVKASVTVYRDRKITPCSAYQYMVRAYRKTSNCSYLSKYTAGETIKAAPACQKISSVSSEKSGIRVKWKNQKNCDGYKIYRKSKGGSYKLIHTISSERARTYLDKTASKGVIYYYAVRAYVEEPYGSVCSRYTASSAIKRK